MESSKNGKDFANELIRGISSDNDDFITKEGYPTQAAFRFDEYDDVSRGGDGFRELSINWLDDDRAIDLLLGQLCERKGNVELQFKAGYCRFPLMAIQLLRDQLQNKHLSYERRPVIMDELNGNKENPYHGNLLLKTGLSSKTETTIKTTLAGLAGAVIKRK